MGNQIVQEVKFLEVCPKCGYKNRKIKKRKNCPARINGKICGTDLRAGNTHTQKKGYSNRHTAIAAAGKR